MKKIALFWGIVFILGGLLFFLSSTYQLASASNPLNAEKEKIVIDLLEKLGKNASIDMRDTTKIVEELHGLLFDGCGAGSIMVDPNNPLYGVFTGCLECVKNGEHHKIYNALMVRPSIDALFDLAPSVKNYCP